MKQAIMKLRVQTQEVAKRERTLMQKLTKKEEEIRTLSVFIFFSLFLFFSGSRRLDFIYSFMNL